MKKIGMILVKVAPEARTEICVVCGEGAVHEECSQNSEFPLVPLLYFTGCGVCGIEYCDTEQSIHNKEQMKIYLDKHPEDDPRLKLKHD